jgi:hypothetical protein
MKRLSIRTSPDRPNDSSPLNSRGLASWLDIFRLIGIILIAVAGLSLAAQEGRKDIPFQTISPKTSCPLAANHQRAVSIPWAFPA